MGEAGDDHWMAATHHNKSSGKFVRVCVLGNKLRLTINSVSIPFCRISVVFSGLFCFLVLSLLCFIGIASLVSSYWAIIFWHYCVYLSSSPFVLLLFVPCAFFFLHDLTLS